MINVYCPNSLLYSARYNEFLIGPPLEGPQVQTIVETIENYFFEKIEDLKQELVELEEELEEKYETDKEKAIEKMDIFHSELSDHHVDIQENIKSLLELLLENDLPEFVSDYAAKIIGEINRLETDIYFELD